MRTTLAVDSDLDGGDHNPERAPGIRQAFVYLDGIDSSAPLRPAATVTIEQRGCEYGPHSMVATAAAPVETRDAKEAETK